MKLVKNQTNRCCLRYSRGLTVLALVGAGLCWQIPAGASEELPQLEFHEVLEVVSSGTHMKVDRHLKANPEMKPVYKEIVASLRRSSQVTDLSPDQVFGQLQKDLRDHTNYEFSVILKEIWYLYELYDRFYAINRTALLSGDREPFVSFIEAIQEGLDQQAECRLNSGCHVLVATDAGAIPNPIYLLSERDLRVGP